LRLSCEGVMASVYITRKILLTYKENRLNVFQTTIGEL
jgi:hypothetical protein